MFKTTLSAKAIIFSCSLALIMAMLMASCTSPKEGTQNISVNEDLGNMKQLQLSDMAQDAKLVKLQTDSTCLIGNNPEFYLAGDHIIAISGVKCLMFSAKDGSFLGEVLHRGQDADSFMTTIRQGSLAVNDLTDEVYFINWQHGILAYHLPSGQKSNYDINTMGNFAFLSEKEFVVAPINFDGQQANSMLMYQGGQLTDSVPNHAKFELIETAINLLRNENLFYRYLSTTYYKNITNDTIFAVGMHGIEPHYIFDFAGKGPTIDLRKRPTDMTKALEKRMVVNSLAETDSYLFYQLTYEQKTHLMAYDKNRHQGMELDGGINDDMASNCKLWPHRVNEAGQMLCALLPWELDDEQLAHLGIGAEDNPAIVISNLKH